MPDRESNTEPIFFKTEDSMWQLMAAGKKQWDARLYDLTDDRIYRLSFGSWVEPQFKGALPSYKPTETSVRFINKLTGEVLQFRFHGLTFVRFAQGWCFMELTGLIARFDKDGKIVTGGA
ncbi:MAG: hypothetical protein ACYDHZ_00915 [Dehalococcoidia bacterium]